MLDSIPSLFSRAPLSFKLLALSHCVIHKLQWKFRDDSRFAYVAAWEYRGEGNDPVLHKEPLVFENVHLATRSYK